MTAVAALPIPNAHFIWYCAWFSLPTAIYAYSHPASAHLAVVPASVWATSLLYWRNPVRDSWRRTLDIAVVFSGLTYQTYYAVHHTPPTQLGVYTALIGTSAVCYGLGHYLWKRGHTWPATYVHAAIHFVANIANMVLYNGVNDSLKKTTNKYLV